MHCLAVACSAGFAAILSQKRLSAMSCLSDTTLPIYSLPSSDDGQYADFEEPPSVAFDEDADNGYMAVDGSHA